MAIVVEFANRLQLLEVVTTLPEELDPKINFRSGELWFTRRGRGLISGGHTLYGYNENKGWFETTQITIPLPSTDEVATTRISQVLLKGITPEQVMVSSISGGKRFLELFREKLLPILLNGRYKIDSATFGVVGPEPISGGKWGPREWGIDGMYLVVKENPVHNLDTRFPIDPIMRVKRDAISGWFNRMLEENKDKFLFVKTA